MSPRKPVQTSAVPTAPVPPPKPVRPLFMDQDLEIIAGLVRNELSVCDMISARGVPPPIAYLTRVSQVGWIAENELARRQQAANPAPAPVAKPEAAAAAPPKDKSKEK